MPVGVIARIGASRTPILLGHAPRHRHDALTENDRATIRAGIATEEETRRKALLRMWRPKGRAVAESLAHAGERFLAFPRLDLSHSKSARITYSAVERSNRHFRHRVRTHHPCGRHARDGLHVGEQDRCGETGRILQRLVSDKPPLLSATMRGVSASLHRRRLPASTPSGRETRPRCDS